MRRRRKGDEVNYMGAMSSVCMRACVRVHACACLCLPAHVCAHACACVCV